MPSLIHKPIERKVYIILRNGIVHLCYKSSTLAIKKVKELEQLYPNNDYVILNKRLYR